MDQLYSDFEVPELQAWRDEVDRLLKGAPFEKRMTTSSPEGITLAPLYTSADRSPADPGLPGQPPFTRGFQQQQPDEIPWKIVEEHLPPLNGGDPLGLIAREGGTLTPQHWEILADYLLKHDPATTLTINLGHYADGGANAIQQLAFLLATGVEYLRRLEGNGVPVEQAAPMFSGGFAMGGSFFLEIAKLRAARRLWDRILEATGIPPRKRGLRIRAWTGRQNKSRLDVHTNILRTTTEAFSAVVGGANIIEVAGFDHETANPGDLGRRIARNIQIILRDEAGLGLVQDPGGGSWYIENLTDRLATAAWKLFQEIESMGGMSVCLASGFVHDWITAVADLRSRALSTGRSVLVGTNRYPEPALDLEALSPHGKPVAEVGDVEIPPIPVRRLAEPFEKLRLAVGTHAARQGDLTVFLATLGPVGRYMPRLDFIASLFEVGGFKVIRGSGFTTPAEAADAALAGDCCAVALVGLDDTWPADAPETARLIREQRPDLKLYLAGNPRDEEIRQTLVAAGVNEFLFLRSDMLATLGDLATTMGVQL